MKSLKLYVTALCLVLGTVGLASADLLVQFQGDAYYGSFGPNEVLARVNVGTSNVTISSFGVYGQAPGRWKYQVGDLR